MLKIKKCEQCVHYVADRKCSLSLEKERKCIDARKCNRYEEIDDRAIYVIGQVIGFEEDFEIKSCLSNSKVFVKKGDKAVITKRGYRILSGDGEGKILPFDDDVNIAGYSTSSMAKFIYEKLRYEHPFDDILEDYDIDSKEIICNIEDTLYDLL